MDRDLDHFSVGDFVGFQREFNRADFDSFSRLSGDTNPLHHDVDYARQSSYGKPIIPLHLLAAPLSAIAGTMLPGHRSLILGTHQRALAPAYYEQPIYYSARITGIQIPRRVMTIRTLALDGSRVLLDAETHVQVRDDIQHPKFEDVPIELRNADRDKKAIVTGATGHIGRAIATRLARSGWKLLLTGRREPALEDVVNECKRLGAEAHGFIADLATEQGRQILKASIGEDLSLAACIHVASADLDAPLERLMDVNFTATRQLGESLLPLFLRRQSGRLLFIGSSAAIVHPAGWESYIASKVAGTDYVQAVHRRYAGYGIFGLTLAPGYVETPFSAQVRAKNHLGLMPEEVAEAAEGLLGVEDVSRSILWLEPGVSTWGNCGFTVTHAAKSIDPMDTDAPTGRPVAPVKLTDEGDLSELTRQFFRLPNGTDLAGAGLDLTTGWDSLRHIEFMLFLESRLGLRFESGEMNRTTRYLDLSALIDAKRA